MCDPWLIGGFATLGIGSGIAVGALLLTALDRRYS